MGYVEWFERLDRGSVPVAGGKGANLGEMVRADFPVPGGFVVTAEAYRAFVEQAGLRADIAHQLAEVDVDDRAALDQTANRIQASIRAAAMPVAIQEAIGTAYRQLCEREGSAELLVAVRSSATLEDTEQASFAGMNRTFLNVRGAEELERKLEVVR